MMFQNFIEKKEYSFLWEIGRFFIAILIELRRCDCGGVVVGVIYFHQRKIFFEDIIFLILNKIWIEKRSPICFFLGVAIGYNNLYIIAGE